MTEAQNREKLIEARRVLEAEFDKIPSVLVGLADACADVVMITSRVTADLFADVRALKCHRDDLHKANNRYLERARTAERERDAWKARWEKATGQTQEQYPLDATKWEPVYQIQYHAQDDWHEVSKEMWGSLGDHGKRVLYTSPPTSELEAQLAEEQRAVEMLVSWAAANNDEPDLLLSDWRATKQQNELLENGIEALKDMVTALEAKLAEAKVENERLTRVTKFWQSQHDVRTRQLGMLDAEATSPAPKVTDEMVREYKRAFNAHMNRWAAGEGEETPADIGFEASRAGLTATLAAVQEAGKQYPTTTADEADPDRLFERAYAEVAGFIPPEKRGG